MRLNPFKRKALSATPVAQEMLGGYGGGYFAFPRSSFVDGAFVQIQAASYAAIYAGQPNVRMVIDHIARIAASRAMRLYTLNGADRTEEVTDHPAWDTVDQPSQWMGQQGMLNGFIRDFLIWDESFLWDMGQVDGQRMLVRVPPYSMGIRGKNQLAPTGYRLLFRDGTWLDLELNEVVCMRGYSGVDTRSGTSPLETLRQDILEETVRQAQNIEFIRGGMVRGGIVQRAIEAPEWSDAARERFEEAWATRLKGVNAGRSPVLEEGMIFVDAGVTPREAEAIAMRQMTLERVAMVYGLHPSLFTEGGGGSLNMARTAREEDVIVPLLEQVAETFTRELVGNIYGERGQFAFGFRPPISSDPEKLFTASKNATQSSVMTVNEFRKQFLGLPPHSDGDELVQNPGATAGGAPAAEPAHATTDRGVGATQEATPKADHQVETKDLRLPVRHDAILARRESYAADYAAMLRGHFERQKKALANGGAADTERWNTELAVDLLKLARQTVRDEANVNMVKLGATKSFDMAYVQNYLTAGADAVAGAINAETQRRLTRGLEGKADTNGAAPKPTRRQVLNEVLAPERADDYATTSATRVAAFAATEAAKQAGDEHVRQKRWIASGLSDSRHSDMDGETVPLFEDFSNGLQYPGDPSGDAGEVANCGCALEIL